MAVCAARVVRDGGGCGCEEFQLLADVNAGLVPMFGSYKCPFETSEIVGIWFCPRSESKAARQRPASVADAVRRCCRRLGVQILSG